MQMQARAGHRPAPDCRRLKSEIDLLLGRLREKEARIDRLQRNLAELKAAKQSHEYLSAARLHFLEASLALHEKEQSSKFLAAVPTPPAHLRLALIQAGGAFRSACRECWWRRILRW